jgi:hypothetical protein
MQIAKAILNGLPAAQFTLHFIPASTSFDGQSVLKQRVQGRLPLILTCTIGQPHSGQAFSEGATLPF